MSTFSTELKTLACTGQRVAQLRDIVLGAVATADFYRFAGRFCHLSLDNVQAVGFAVFDGLECSTSFVDSDG